MKIPVFIINIFLMGGFVAYILSSEEMCAVFKYLNNVVDSLCIFILKCAFDKQIKSIV